MLLGILGLPSVHLNMGMKWSECWLSLAIGQSTKYDGSVKELKLDAKIYFNLYFGYENWSSILGLMRKYIKQQW